MKLLLSVVVAAAVSANTAAQAPRPAGATLFEGARLITGDGGAPIERSAFLVQNGRFTRVGRQGEVPAPAGAVRVDLTGKTVIPALIDAHSHIGYMKDLTSGPQNYTRENILDHLYRFAYFGVAASQAMGSDFGELPFQLREEMRAGKDPDAARFLTAGRGLAPLEEISPANMRHAAYVVTTVEGARADVQELAQRKVPLVKMWVDTRGGTIETLTPDLYGAILDEAHRHGMRVAVHATGLADAKNLLRAGIDVFAHMISDVDDELARAFQAASEHRDPAGAERAAAHRVGALAQPAASADPRDGLAPRRSCGCSSGWPDRRRRRSSRGAKRGIDWRGASGCSPPPASGLASAPMAAVRTATSSSAGRCTPRWKTWSWPA